MSTMSNLARSGQICRDLPRSRPYEIYLIMSKCQSNYQNVNQIVKLSQYQMSCISRDQSVYIKLAHRLCTDFQYFFYPFGDLFELSRTFLVFLFSHYLPNFDFIFSQIKKQLVYYDNHSESHSSS